MTGFVLFRQLHGIPRPFDESHAAAAFDRLRDSTADQGALLDELVTDQQAADLFRSICGTSPYLENLLRREMGFLHRFRNATLDQALEGVFDEVATAGRQPSPLPQTDFAQHLRVAKARVALLVAVADIGNAWGLHQVTSALSRFADAVVTAAVDYLLIDAADRGDLVLDDRLEPARSSGFFVIGMGKLGAGELNYSSDIDLIALFDQDVIRYVGKTSPQDCFVRLTRGLTALLQDRTADGYVLRVDLRLRPDAGATPVAMSVLAAETYYESVGQNWERAAMIKARVVAGDHAAGNDFLRRLIPFVWRKHLDFAAINDIHSIKRQVDAKVGRTAQAELAGYNVKLGRGGIREIEFFAQTQQLIAGGRDPTLRDATTCGAIRALATSKRITEAAARELITSYDFLRRTEHRLQMVADEQTQRLPLDPTEMRRVAVFLGYEDAAAFSRALLRVLETVRGHYAALFEDAPALGAESGSLVFTGTEDDPETLESLSRMGYREPRKISTAVRQWHHGRLRATRSVRARELLTALGPRLLTALAATENPDAAFLKFDEFLAKLPAGVQLFSLFYSNPGLLDLVAEVVGSAPRLAELLGRTPSILDSLLTENVVDPPPDREVLGRTLASDVAMARDYQDVLDIARRWARDRRFLIGARVLRGTLSAHDAGPYLSDVADLAIAGLLDAVSRDFASRHGVLERASFAVIAYGKLGSREMTFGSDLDLTFVYDIDLGDTPSNGPRPLSATTYFARFSQQMIAAISAMTAEGKLYDIDMRLRPSGTSGPIAVSFDSFVQYQRQSAWTWERMALTRARVVAGPATLRAKIEAAVREVLVAPRDVAALARDVDDMRQRIEHELPEQNPWRLKYVRGGLLDAEFLCQMFQLRFAHQDPSVVDSNTVRTLERIERSGLLPSGVADELRQHITFYHNIEGLIRLCLEHPFEETTAPAGLRAGLARAAAVATLDEVRGRLVRSQARVSDIYRRSISDLLREAPQA